MSLAFDKYDFLARLGLSESNQGCFDGKTWSASGPVVETHNPCTGETVARTTEATLDDLERCVANMTDAQKIWAATPAPQRGEIVRQIGNALREQIVDLGAVISMEMGKIKSEGVGEVQESVDIADFACGLSRMLNGKMIPSERADHVILETWRPIGLQGSGVAIISAFNFPNAVAMWNALVALACGNCCLWKGAPTSNMVTIATTKVIADVLAKNDVPAGVFTMVLGGGESIGQAMVADKRFPLVSFTGSERVGGIVAQEIAKTLGRKYLLELGGNNASVIMPDADIDMATKSSVFGAVGTAGQRCTSLRRLLVHADVYDQVVSKMVSSYKTIRPGNPLDDGTLLGPVHNENAIKTYLDCVEAAKAAGGRVLTGGNRIDRPGFYVEPTIIEFDEHNEIMQQEYFVPILFVVKISSYEEGVKLNNSVPQGLSSCLYTRDMRLMWRWVGSGPDSCDTGLRNVNSGTSGAEIGGAFGGEKSTGGGRESGSDAWKQYMTRGTCCVSFSNTLALAQGVSFE